MKDQEIKKLIPAFLEGDLDADTREIVRKAINGSDDLKREMQRFESSWQVLGDWKDVEPQHGYVSRFWSELLQKTPWYETLWNHIRQTFLTPRLLPAVITACVFIVVGVVVSRNMMGVQETEMLLTNIGSEGIEFLENYELAEHFEVIEDLDFYEDYDVILQWKKAES